MTSSRPLADHALGPTAVAGRWSARRLRLAVAWPLLLGALPFLTQDAYYLDTLVLTFIWAAYAGAWNLVGGYAGQFSLGHAAFFGIGAYTSSVLLVRWGISPWLGMWAGAALAAALASLLGAISIRLRGPYYIIVTIAAAEVVRIWAIQWRAVTQGSEGLWIPFQASLARLTFEDKAASAWAALILALLVYAVTLAVDRSRLGYYLRAARDDEAAAQAVGVNVFAVRWVASLLSAALAALSGTLYAQYVLFLEPQTVMSFEMSVQPALLSIIGGLGTPSGPLVGSLLLTPLSQFLRGWLGGSAHRGLYLLLYGVGLTVAVFALPRGVVATLEHLRGRQVRRLRGLKAAERA